MNDELSTLVQVINFYTRTLGSLGHAIRLTAAGAHKGIDIARLKVMQHKMKLHYASTGTHDTMTLADLERLTGDNYAILNIPLEDESDLVHFYDALKKAKVSFAELPDLNLGDGYTQIAYDPRDRDKVNGVVDSYKRLLHDKPQDMTTEEYVRSGGDKGEELLSALAIKGYEREEALDLIARMKERNLDPAYKPISINRNSMLVKETKEAYYFRIPKKSEPDGTTYALRVEKRDAVYIDGGKTVYTHINENELVTLYPIDEHGQLYESLQQREKGPEVTRLFSEVPRRTIDKVNHMTPEDTDMLPDFTRGQGHETVSAREIREGSIGRNDDTRTSEKTDSMSHSSRDLPKEHTQGRSDAIHSSASSSDIEPLSPEQQLLNITKYENLKDMYLSEDSLVLDIDLDEHLIVKGPSQYMVALPGAWGEDELFCIGIDKDKSVISSDGKILRTFLNQDEDILVHNLTKNGKHTGEFVLRGDEIAKSYHLKDNVFSLEPLTHTPEKGIPKTLLH